MLLLFRGVESSLKVFVCLRGGRLVTLLISLFYLLVTFLHFNYTSVLEPPYWIFSQCSIHASNDEESKNVRLLFLKSLANQRAGPKLYINIIYTRNNAKFRQRITEVNYLRENLPHAVFTYNEFTYSITSNRKRKFTVYVKWKKRLEKLRSHIVIVILS